MAGCLTASSHHMNQCWLIISEILRHSQEMLKIPILDISLEITDSRLQPYPTGANELSHCHHNARFNFRSQHIFLLLKGQNWVQTIMIWGHENVFNMINCSVPYEEYVIIHCFYTKKLHTPVIIRYVNEIKWWLRLLVNPRSKFISWKSYFCKCMARRYKETVPIS